MSFITMRVDLTDFIKAEPYTAIFPATATNYPGLGLVQVKALLEASSGEEGIIAFRHDTPALTFAPDNPESLGSIDSDFYDELKAVAVKFWELYVIATLPA